MKLTIVQTDIVWEEKLRNLERLGEIILSGPSENDIVILPEMFNTGFTMNTGLSEAPGSVTFEWMKSISKKGNFGLCGSYIVREGSACFNRWIFVSGDDDVYTYDKRHLFSPGNEDKSFTPGKRRVVFNYRGFRISPNICYDLRFPVWSRNRNDYDLLINSANWPESRRDVWTTLLKARAIENQCYVAGANRIGTDGEGLKYFGDSVIVNPRGEIIASGGSYTESLVTGEISMDQLESFRNKFSVWKDADDFSIRL
ncbi:MAG: amidohydrolase [Bacteroidales bacterium]